MTWELGGMGRRGGGGRPRVARAGEVEGVRSLSVALQGSLTTLGYIVSATAVHGML